MLARAATLVLVVAAAAAAISACGGEPVDPRAVGAERAGSVGTLADCGDWRRGGVEQRLATIAHVRSQVGDGDAASTPVMPDGEAYEFFQRACAREYASSFRLYKLYNRGASFRELAR